MNFLLLRKLALSFLCASVCCTNKSDDSYSKLKCESKDIGSALGRQRPLVGRRRRQGSCSGRSPVFLEILCSMSVAKTSMRNKIMNVAF